MNKKEEEIIKTIYSRNPASVYDKNEGYALYLNGFYGNKPKTRDSYKELVNSGYKGNVTLRTKNRVGGKGITKYDLTLEKAKNEISNLQKQGFNKEYITFNESMPDNLLLMQGELVRTHEGLYFTYSTEKTQMNKAMMGNPSKLNVVKGLQAKLLLQKNMTPESYEDLQILLETFPNDIIELSSWGKNIGNLPRRNSLIWEIRKNQTHKYQEKPWFHF